SGMPAAHQGLPTFAQLPAHKRKEIKPICYTTSLMRERATVTLSTVLVDDEELARDELKFLLQDFPEVDVIATGSNGLEAVDLVARLEPDLLFLDVQMPGLDGVGVVRK